MLFIILSPFLALLCDRVNRRNEIARRWRILLILVSVIPTSVLWASEYSFTNRSFSFVAATLFLTGIQLALFSIVNVRHSIKLAATVAFALLLAFIGFSSAFLSEWGGGSRTVLKEVKYENYTAHILGPQLYESYKLLRVKKTALSGVVQKNIYEQDLPDSVLNGNCNIPISDGSKRLVFNLCNTTLRLDD
jgi:hypothetical protein